MQTNNQLQASLNGCSPAASINLISNLNVERVKEALTGCDCLSPEKVCNWH